MFIIKVHKTESGGCKYSQFRNCHQTISTLGYTQTFQSPHSAAVIPKFCLNTHKQYMSVGCVQPDYSESIELVVVP